MGKYAQQGYDACIAGKPSYSNPHVAGTGAFDEWAIGWHMANVEEAACASCAD